MMEQFTLDPERFSEIRRQLLRRTVLMGSLAIGGVGIMEYVRGSYSGNLVPALIAFFVLVPAALGAGHVISVRRQKEIYDSYRLHVDLLTITREQQHTETVSIPMNDVQKISEDGRGNLFIRSSQARGIIAVPLQLQHRDAFLELAQRNNWPIVPEPVSTPRRMLFRALPIVFIAAFVLFQMTTNRFLIALLGISLTAALVYSFVVTLRNRSVDRRTKRTSWILIIVLLSIIVSTILRLTQSTVAP